MIWLASRLSKFAFKVLLIVFSIGSRQASREGGNFLISADLSSLITQTFQPLFNRLRTTQKAPIELYLDAKNNLYSKTSKLKLQVRKLEQATKSAETPKPKTRTMVLAIIIVVILIVVGVGIYILTRPPGTTTNGTPVSIFDAHPLCSQVTPANCGFSPSTLTVKIGTNNTVTWTNNGGQAHTVTSNQTANGSLPSFNSNGINANQQYTFTFTQAGTYHYYCEYHVWMEAVVVVSA